MPTYEYKSEFYNRKTDGQDPITIIQDETTDQWRYVDSFQLFRNEWVLIFETKN